ncbi:MAG: HD domain-containing protein [Gammaproteobacteria bacterium]|nr:HD domain-containing protein [Gammaproteobacteria bacterium]
MKPATRYSIVAAMAALLLLVAAGVGLINAYIEGERERDLLQWESRLGLVADARADAVARLAAGYRRDLEELAANASLRFYLWQLAQAAAAPGDSVEPGALGYLRNLLLGAADRYGYVAADSARIPANLPQRRSAGLALLDARLQRVVQTPGFPDCDACLEVARTALADPRAHTVHLVADADERPVVVTAVAVGTVPGASPGGSDAPLGVLLGVRGAGDELFPLLERGAAFAEAAEALLLVRRGDVVVLASPLADGSPALRRTLPADRGELAEVAATTTPGRFFTGSNYHGDEVLQVSRSVRGQDWVLAQQVDAGQALSLADERRRFLLLALSLLLVAIVAVAVAAWRHGSGVRARHEAGESADKAARLQRQTDLLHTITDNLDVLTVLATSDGRVLFTNQAAASAAGRSIAEVVDSSLAAVLPAPMWAAVQEGIGRAREQAAAVHKLLAWETPAGPREFHASFIPVARIGAESDLVLIVMSDVTVLRQAQKRHMDLLRRLVLTLVSAVDRHDPHSANHARRMTEVADALARELGFSDQERSTLDLAASLANIGKIMIPVEILTKREPLSAAEQALLHKHVEFGLELLRGLQFDGPVLDIIAQKQERPDGHGYPHGLPAEQLTLAGQVLAVANAFVALVGGRAYRPGLSVAAALDELMRTAGTQFDRRVVAALFHVAENRRDWSQWR